MVFKKKNIHFNLYLLRLFQLNETFLPISLLTDEFRTT